MSLLQPLWWLLALLAIPLVLWHGRRARTVPVPTLQLWQRAVLEAKHAPEFSWKPRLTSSLLLQLIALLALIAGLSGPRSADEVFDHRIYVLDRSASMAAAVDSGTPLEKAVERLRQELVRLDSRARGGSFVSLVTVGSEIDVVAARHSSARAGLNRLEDVQATQSPDAATWRRVAEVVRGIGASDASVEVTVLTDGPGEEGARRALSDGDEDFHVHVFGQGQQSTGLASVRATRLRGSDDGWRVEGDVISYPPSETPVVVEAVFTRAGSEVGLPWAETRVSTQGEATPFSIETSFPGAGLLTLRVADDVLPVDNEAHIFVREAPVPLRILIRGDVAATLREALASLPGAQIRAVGVAEPVSEDARFDLEVIAGSDGRADASADTVLWLGGATPEGPVGLRPNVPARIQPGSGHPQWSPVTDMPTGAIESASDVPRLDGAQELLGSSSGPLLQVREQDGRTDIVAAWQVGSTRWTRELGFSAWISDLGRAAAPRHGTWTAPRCIVGRACSALEGRVAPIGAALGLRGAGDDRWVLDSEAGAESDVLRAGSDPGTRAESFPWKWMDRVLFALAAALLAADGLRALWLRRRSPTGPRTGTTRRRIAAAARAAAVVALLLAATGVQLALLLPAQGPIVVVDPWSWAMGAEDDNVEVTPLDRALRAAHSIVVAERAGRVVPAARTSESSLRPPDEAEPVGYDFRAALNMAYGLLGSSGDRVILAGVGHEGGRATEGLAERFEARGAKVDYLPAASPKEDEAWVADLDTPVHVRAGEEIQVHTAVGGPARREHVIEVSMSGEPVGTVPGSSRWGSVTFDAPEPGEHEIRATLRNAVAAGLSANDATSAWLEVHEAGNVAVVSPEELDAEGFVEQLREKGYRVHNWRPSEVPVDTEELLSLDVVALLDVPAAELHSRQQATLERWVREHGGGVLLAGAERAYGPGGYLRTPLEVMSPLSARVPGEQPRAAVAFVLDRSGSMQQTEAGVSRLAIAKKATLAAVELLHPESQVSVIVFDDVARTVFPLAPPEGLEPVLGPVVPGGGTDMYPALDTALSELENADAEAKHVIALTDGLTESAPFDELVERARASNVSISTVAIGRGAERRLLESIAQGAGGVFHASDDARALPSILSQEALLLSGNPVQEGETAPIVQPERPVFLEGLSGDFPSSGGYVRTTPKPEADIHVSTSDGDPLLASWRHGLGRVVAMTMPLAGPWATPWVSGTYATEMLHNTLRWLVRPVAPPGVRVRVRHEADTLLVDVEVVDAGGNSVEGTRLDVRADGPSDSELGPVPLADMGNGRYLARLPAYEPGQYRVRVEPAGSRPRQEQRSAEVLSHVSYPASLAPESDRSSGPAALARATGGQVLLDDDSLASNPSWRFRRVNTPVPWVLIALALGGGGLVIDGMRWQRSVPRG